MVSFIERCLTDAGLELRLTKTGWFLVVGGGRGSVKTLAFDFFSAMRWLIDVLQVLTAA